MNANSAGVVISNQHTILVLVLANTNRPHDSKKIQSQQLAQTQT